MFERIIRTLWAFAFVTFGYIIIIYPVEVLWNKVHPLVAIGYVFFIGIIIYGELYLQEKFPQINFNGRFRKNAKFSSENNETRQGVGITIEMDFTKVVTKI